MRDAIRRLIRILAGSERLGERDLVSLVVGDPREIGDSHPLLSTRGMNWSAIAAFLGAQRALWLAIPTDVLKAETLDTRRYIFQMAESLFGEPTAEDVSDLRKIVKRIRQYVVFGRASNEMPLTKFMRLLGNQNGRCSICGYKFREEDLEARDYVDEPGEDQQTRGLRPPQIDHIVPIFLGGHEDWNLQVLCRPCNAAKGASLAWPTRSSVFPPTGPRRMFKLNGSGRWAALARYRACNRCEKEASVLEDNAELQVERVDPRRGWLLENLQLLCTDCAAQA